MWYREPPRLLSPSPATNFLFRFILLFASLKVFQGTRGKIKSLSVTTGRRGVWRDAQHGKKGEKYKFCVRDPPCLHSLPAKILRSLLHPVQSRCFSIFSIIRVQSRCSKTSGGRSRLYVLPLAGRECDNVRTQTNAKQKCVNETHVYTPSTPH